MRYAAGLRPAALGTTIGPSDADGALTDTRLYDAFENSLGATGTTTTPRGALAMVTTTDSSAEEQPRAARAKSTCLRSCVTVAAVVLCLLATCEVARRVRPDLFLFPLPALTFDAEAWKSADSGGTVRGQMLKDIARRRLLDGKTVNEVKAMLGPPDWVGGPPGRRTSRAHPGWRYNLGPCSGFQMDPDILVIEFDTGGTVARWWWYQT